MNSRKIEFAVGLFVLAGLAAMIYLAVTIGGGREVLRGAEQLAARFTNAGGIKPGSPVRIAGVTVGEVSKVAVKGEDMSALISFRVQPGVKLDDDTVAMIRSNGLIGEKFIALKPGSSGVPFKPGAVIIDTESAVDLEDLIARFAFGSTDKSPAAAKKP